MKISFLEHTNPLLNTCILDNNKGTKAVVYPVLGASLQQLFIDNKTIINNIKGSLEEPKLQNSSCSAILFPYANRIDKGQYSYNNKSYQLFCNETARGHAMHGLVYREPFEIVGSSCTDEAASVSFLYIQGAENVGFPFPFKLFVTYTLEANRLKLEIKAENTGVACFPFSLGWHPYFYSTDLDKSELRMDSREAIQTNEQMIPQQIIPNDFPNPLSLKGQAFDNGFVLENSIVQYQTPDYVIDLKIEEKEPHQYIQLYIPSHRESIAIEPMTAATDCYNNGWGTKELVPNTTYKTSWTIETKTDGK